MNATVVAQFTVPGTTATIAITQTAPDMFQVVYDAPAELGGDGSFLNEPTEAKAREVANHVWAKIVGLRNLQNAYTNRDQQVPGLPGVTYGQVAAATSTANPRYAGVRAAREEAKKILAALVPDHSTFRVAVRVSEDDKLRFFQLDMPLKGKWKGCLFMKEQASDELYRVRDIVREEAVLREVIKDAAKALHRYGMELGTCGMCGRTLTDEASRTLGIGPICADKL